MFVISKVQEEKLLLERPVRRDVAKAVWAKRMDGRPCAVAEQETKYPIGAVQCNVNHSKYERQIVRLTAHVRILTNVRGFNTALKVLSMLPSASVSDPPTPFTGNFPTSTITPL